jgi:hypothetical protein
MSVSSAKILKLLGYEVDKKGNVLQSTNQLGIISIENTSSGGFLRVHGDVNQFFYEGDPTLENQNLAFPYKVTDKYIYFHGSAGKFRIENKEFIENALLALKEANALIKKDFGG